jgi:hypothetical protein
MGVELLDAVMGPIVAALRAVGRKALSDAEDQSASGLVAAGRKLLARLCHRGGSGSGQAARPQLEAASADVAADPQDADFRAALRGQVKKALAGTDGVDDPTLAADLARLLEAAGIHVSAEGAGSVAVAENTGIISTGPDATNTIHRGGA